MGRFKCPIPFHHLQGLPPLAQIGNPLFSEWEINLILHMETSILIVILRNIKKWFFIKPNLHTKASH
jgi:hypothetical protein